MTQIIDVKIVHHNNKKPLKRVFMNLEKRLKTLNKNVVCKIILDMLNNYSQAAR